MMYSPRANQSVPKLNVLKKSRLVNNAVPLSTSHQRSRNAKGIFRQWGDPPPPPSSRARTCERTQNTTPKKRPGSADPRFRRRIDKSESASAVDKTNIGDHKEISKSENGTPRKIHTDGERMTDHSGKAKNVLEMLEQTRHILETKPESTICYKNEKFGENKVNEKQKSEESTTKLTKLLDHEESPIINYVFDEEKQVSEHILEKENTNSFQNDSLDFKFHDHTFYSSMQQKYIPITQKDKPKKSKDDVYESFLEDKIRKPVLEDVNEIFLGEKIRKPVLEDNVHEKLLGEKIRAPVVQDDIYEKFLREKIKVCTSQSVMSIPVYNAELTKFMKDYEEDNISSIFSAVQVTKPHARSRDLYLVLASALGFGLITYLIMRHLVDVNDLLKHIPCLQPEPEPTITDHLTTLTEFIINSCISFVGFMYKFFTMSVEESCYKF